MLYIGEQVGRRDAGRRDAPGGRHRGRSARGHEPRRATGRPNAITVLAASEKGGLLHAPDTYIEKLCVGPVAAGKVDIRERRPRTCAGSRRPSAARVNDITVDHPRPAAPRGADRGGPRRPARGSS